MKPLLAAALTLLATAASGQAPPKSGCDSPESRQFDFWVGNWGLSHQGGKSRNRITKTLGGCAIVEQFEGAPGSPLEGTSVSAYDQGAKRWKQTWVDNTGAYLDFAGGFADGRMVLEREALQGARKFRQRMVFQDIAKDSLKWLWQRSDDDGKTWVTNWEIDYRRVE
jgi:hypothetical protein